MTKKKAGQKKGKVEPKKDQNKMVNPEYQNQVKVKLLIDAKTSKGPFKAGEIISLPHDEAQGMISKKEAESAS
jgi:hypothetical protein